MNEYLPEIEKYPEETAMDKHIKEKTGDGEDLAVMKVKNEETLPQTKITGTEERDDVETEVSVEDKKPNF